jgi:hypothetical protein
MKKYLAYSVVVRYVHGAVLLALLVGATSCASHKSLQQKTRWYKHHSGGKSVPCPCGH